MIITQVDFIKLRCSVPEDHLLPTASFVSEGSIYLRVHTDQGISGLGEPSPYGARFDTAEALFHKTYREQWIGLDPLAQTSIASQKNSGFGYGNVGENALLAGFYQALWDIRGKYEGLPLHRMLNPESKGVVQAYASAGMWYADTPPEVVVEEALGLKEAGYTAYKLRPETPRDAGGHLQRNATPPPVDVPRLIGILQDIRTQAGELFDIMVDTGCRLTFDEAVTLCKAMEELNCSLLEEPLPRDPAQYAQLKKHTTQTIAGGECLTCIDQFRPWVEQNSLDILQPDANLAGISEIIDINELGSSKDIPLVMHNWANDISIAANVHLGAALDSCSIVEYNMTYNPLRANLVTDPIVPREGEFRLSDAPGLGVELSPEALARFAF